LLEPLSAPRAAQPLKALADSTPNSLEARRRGAKKKQSSVHL